VVQHFVGAGPTGEVFAAERQGRSVAIKILTPDLAADRTFMERLSRLSTHLGKIQHQGVARVLGEGEHRGLPVLVRELVPGRSAADMILHTGPFPPNRAIALALGAAEALTEAHRAGALHLNLKPSNLFILDNDQVKLVDFGVGQRLVLDRGAIYGDPRYLAPEQFEGKLVSFRSDIYGLGCLLYYLLTGMAPHQDDPSIWAGPVQRDPHAPSLVNPALRGKTKLDELVFRAIQYAPNKRYLSVQHFGRVLDGALSELQGSMGMPPTRRPAQTLRMGEMMSPDTYHPSPPQALGYGNESMLPIGEDTVRMPLPPDDRMGGAPPPPPFYGEGGFDTVRQPIGQVMGRQDHDTVRVPVAPMMELPGQPFVLPQPHSFSAQPASDSLEIDIVTEEPIPLLAPLKKRRKKKKKDPIIAVRPESAFRMERGHASFNQLLPGESVMVENEFLDEARGPQRNLETMEIRLPTARPGDEVPRPGMGRLGKYILAAGALLLLFVLAALGAAALAHWLSTPP
jgi:serine/threonine protein kinase